MKQKKTRSDLKKLIVTHGKSTYILCLLFVLIFLYSCNSKIPDKEKIFVVSLLSKTDPTHFVLNPDKHYWRFNFIIDSIGDIYYFGLEGGEWGVQTYNHVPGFVNLRPYKLVQIPSNSIIAFLKCNVLHDQRNEANISIASQRDTINSKGFSELYEFLKDSTGNRRFTVRMTTYEEDMAVYLKKGLYTKHPECIKWDTTRIHYPQWLFDEDETPHEKYLLEKI